jgi:uncharacterized membrane protein
MPWFGNSRWSIPEEHAGEVIGAIAGGIFGLLVIIAGFWRALVFGVFVVAGLLLGRYVDDHDSLKAAIIRRFRRPRY